MVHLLYKYLIIHKQVAIPGVGLFYIDRKPARHDIANKVFQSPELNIDFKAGTTITDKEFYQFVSKEKGIDEVEAVKHLHDFAHRLKQEVSANKRVELPGMGVLIKNGMGQVSFEAHNALTSYFPPIVEERILVDRPAPDITNAPLTAVSQQEESDTEPPPSNQRKDYWWVYAIVLGVIGIAIIMYYYYENGTLL